jgi:hypothetical protein
MSSEAVIVLGAVVIALSGFVTAALDAPSAWHRIGRFVLGVIILLCMAAGGAWMGIVIREAFKAIP